jgi:hypothetical protein
MTQTLTLPGVALQWKAVGPFNAAPTATVSIRPHFPFGEGAGNTGSVVFPATNVNPSNASFFAVPLIGSFDMNGRLLGPDGYPLVVPALDTYSASWLRSPLLYEIQIDLEGVSGQRGVFAAFQNVSANFSQGHGGVVLSDANASTSATTGSGSTYTGTVYLADTVVHPILVNQTVYITTLSGGFTAVVNSINLLTNTAAITTTTAQSAQSSVTFSWGNTVNLGLDLSKYVNWI